MTTTTTTTTMLTTRNVERETSNEQRVMKLVSALGQISSIDTALGALKDSQNETERGRTQRGQ